MRSMQPLLACDMRWPMPVGCLIGKLKSTCRDWLQKIVNSIRAWLTTYNGEERLTFFWTFVARLQKVFLQCREFLLSGPVRYSRETAAVNWIYSKKKFNHYRAAYCYNYSLPHLMISYMTHPTLHMSIRWSYTPSVSRHSGARYHRVEMYSVNGCFE